MGGVHLIRALEAVGHFIGDHDAPFELVHGRAVKVGDDRPLMGKARGLEEVPQGVIDQLWCHCAMRKLSRKGIEAPLTNARSPAPFTRSQRDNGGRLDARLTDPVRNFPATELFSP